jgi:hypothetical protein
MKASTLQPPNHIAAKLLKAVQQTDPALRIISLVATIMNWLTNVYKNA